LAGASRRQLLLVFGEFGGHAVKFLFDLRERVARVFTMPVGLADALGAHTRRIEMAAY